MKIEPFHLLSGALSFIFVFICCLIGLKIAFKYFLRKERTFLLVGLAWFGLGSPWLADAVNFIMIVFLNTMLIEELYFILIIPFVPLFLLMWLIAVSEMYYKEKEKYILIISIGLIILFEIFFFAFLYIDHNLIGRYVTPFQIEFSLFIEIFFIVIIIVTVSTGIHVALKSIKSNHPETRINGIFLFFAFVLYAIGAICDSSLELTEITVIVVRLILMVSAFCYYLGFFLPDYLKKILLREENTINFDDKR